MGFPYHKVPAKKTTLGGVGVAPWVADVGVAVEDSVSQKLLASQVATNITCVEVPNIGFKVSWPLRLVDNRFGHFSHCKDVISTI